MGKVSLSMMNMNPPRGSVDSLLIKWKADDDRLQASSKRVTCQARYRKNDFSISGTKSPLCPYPEIWITPLPATILVLELATKNDSGSNPDGFTTAQPCQLPTVQCGSHNSTKATDINVHS